MLCMQRGLHQLGYCPSLPPGTCHIKYEEEGMVQCPQTVVSNVSATLPEYTGGTGRPAPPPVENVNDWLPWEV